MDDHILNTRPLVPEHVVYRSFEGETLLLNLDSGEYHGLNETGARMLELMRENSETVRETIGRLAEEYGVAASEIQDDLVEFCGSLAERGLVELVPPPETQTAGA